jgi:hypothetical protein
MLHDCFSLHQIKRYVPVKFDSALETASMRTPELMRLAHLSKRRSDSWQLQCLPPVGHPKELGGLQCRGGGFPKHAAWGCDRDEQCLDCNSPCSINKTYCKSTSAWVSAHIVHSSIRIKGIVYMSFQPYLALWLCKTCMPANLLDHVHNDSFPTMLTIRSKDRW